MEGLFKMCEVYDNLTGICIEHASFEGPLEDRHLTSDLPVINGLLTEDVFALVMEHCSVPQRAQLASVCKLWNGLVKRGWKSITLHDPNLAKQMTWLKKINQDTLKDLSIYGSRHPPGAMLLLQLDVLSCITRFSRLKSIELELDGQFLVSPSFLGQLSVLRMLETLKAGCTVTNIEEATDLSELAVLTSLKHLDLTFAQQPPLNLSAHLSALEKLTHLRLSGARSLRQQGGSISGALCSLFSQLLHLDLWVQTDLEVDLVAPMLTSAHLVFESLQSSVPALCPGLLTMDLVAPPLTAQHLMGITALKSLTMGYGHKVSAPALTAVKMCHSLAHLEVGEYILGVDGNYALEEFCTLTSLESLDLAFTNESRRYSISPKLSNLRLLRTLRLAPRPEQHFSGGLHHLQSLASATLSGSYRGPPLHSKSLVSLTIRGFEGFGFEPEEVLPLGSFPKLTSLTLSDALEARISRFVCLESLSSLKELVIHLEYTAASQPITTYQPADGDDVTQLLASMHVMPALQSVEIQAMRRNVVLEHVGRMHYKHLSLACTDLSIPPTEAAALAELKSLRLVFETGHPETLDMLAQLGASQQGFSAGDLYLCKELQEVRLRPTPHASSVVDHAHHSLKTVYDDGYFL